MSPGFAFALAAGVAIGSFALLVSVVWLAVWGAMKLWSLRREPKKLGRVALIAAMGPITGPLYARAEACMKEGKPVVAAAWAAAIPLVWFDLANAATVLVHHAMK
ncbi:MAG TPA: hypothetical protein VG269_01995 [Tepidisphaeraceae bacterium]|jgi:hypothetical protein|nr:hypothetical protein [Tepidisphaeraceae bacterium]